MKVLSIQLHSAPNDPPENYRRAFKMLEYGVELYEPDVIMLPEGFAGFRTEIPHRDFAEPVPGPATDRFCEYSRRFNVMILFGLIRKAPSGDGIYNSIMIIDQGEVIGIYDKTHLSMDNRPEYQELYSEQAIFIPGKRLGVFDTRFGRIGVLICHDGEFPEPWRAMVLEGAEAIFWPMSAGDFSSWAMLHARWNAVPVFTCNPIGSYDDGTRQGGGSVFADVHGRPLDKADTAEAFLFADVDLAAQTAFRTEGLTPQANVYRVRRHDLYGSLTSGELPPIESTAPSTKSRVTSA